MNKRKNWPNIFKFSTRLCVECFLLLFCLSVEAAGIATDANVSKDNLAPSTVIVSPTFSTASGNELLLAFIAADANTGQQVNSLTTPGITWNLVKRQNAQLGIAEIWSAFATSTLNNVNATGTLAQSFTSSMTIVSFTGVSTSSPVGASAGASAASGAQTVSLTTTGIGSWVWGGGDDWDTGTSRTLGANQTLVHQFLSGSSDTFWVQRQSTTTTASGTVVTINDTAPTTDRWNLAAVEIICQYCGDITSPTVSSVAVQSLTTINVTFSEAMGTGVTMAANYTISESGQGTLATHPNTVTLVSGNTYVLTWSSGVLANAADVTITVANAQDLAGNTIGSPNSGIYIIRAILDFGTKVKDIMAGIKNHFHFH